MCLGVSWCVLVYPDSCLLLKHFLLFRVTLQDHFSTVASYAAEPQNVLAVVTTSSLSVLEGILIALVFIIGIGGKYALDYRLVHTFTLGLSVGLLESGLCTVCVCCTWAWKLVHFVSAWLLIGWLCMYACLSGCLFFCLSICPFYSLAL